MRAREGVVDRHSLLERTGAQSCTFLTNHSDSAADLQSLLVKVQRWLATEPKGINGLPAVEGVVVIPKIHSCHAPPHTATL
jgi:hypothetical protein